MSYVVGTSMAAFRHGQDRPGGVPVPVGGIAAVQAPEGSFGEREAVLGSCSALSARHGGVGGRNEHHLPGRPLATLGQFALRSTDRRVRGFARHRGLGQEQRLEVQIKGRSSRLLREEFPHLRSRLPTLWTKSYFVATVGGAALEVTKRYVENQPKA